MTGASKILTVSYGTFSCTLEGFDDPFNTMKAIAEYFRDLAAGDRYFGAEPPTPDAAMLHRIAEREIQRRVEAKIQDNGVILRAGDAAEAPTAEPVARPALLDAPMHVQTASVTEAGPESVAARLQRIRARHAQAAPVAAATLGAVTDAPVMAETALAKEAYIEDQHADEVMEAVPVATLTPGETASRIEAFDQAEEISGFAPASSFADAAFDVPEALISDRLLPDADAPLVAAKGALAAEHLATVIEDGDQDFEPAAEIDFAMLEGLTADQPTEAVTEPASDLPEDQQDAEVEPVALVSGFDPIDLPEEIASQDTTEFDETALLSRLSVADAGPTAAGDDLAAAEDEDDDAVLGAADAPAPGETADLDDDEDLTLEALSDAPRDSDLAAKADEAPIKIEDLDQAAQNDAADAEASSVPTMPSAPAAAEAAPRARARVIRIRRAAPPEAEGDTTPALEAEIAAEPPVQPAPTGILSDEAEAALQAELAALEAELGGAVVAAEAAMAPEVTPVAATVAPEPTLASRPINVPAENEAVSRLMAQAATQMGGEETRRRQSAIAHLKAAVAATEADRAVTGGRLTQGEQRMEPYRNDLDRVVRPRRPQAEATTPRPPAVPDATARPTPLVLVSAQRIDQPRPAAAQAVATDAAAPRVVMPVRPRRPALAQPSADLASTDLASAQRVMMQETDQAGLDDGDVLTPEEAENLFSDATSFQDFADQLGAEALPDLLEAAAVYCAEVLQRPEFSRPLVMRQIAALPGQSQTAREDYLRGFGTLLRQGRITKVKRGMFALTDRSPYLAEARKLAV
jgi:hypothetical protein